MSKSAVTNADATPEDARAGESAAPHAIDVKTAEVKSGEIKSVEAKAGKHASPRVKEYETKSSAGTVEIGRKLAEMLSPPRLMILRGDLGAGKTTLVKGIATALGAAEPDEVTSPTFTLVHEYSGALDGKPMKLLHLDLYRLDSERQLESLGLEEMQTPDALILIEWGEKFKSIKKRADGEIVITSAGGDTRKIVVTLN